MSWIEKLYRTYENNNDHIGDKNDEVPLLPIFHTTKKRAHVEIVLNEKGEFNRAFVISEENAKTILSATEKSAGRTSGCAPHPLADQLQYVATEYEKYGGPKEHYFDPLPVKFEGNKKLLGALLADENKDRKGCLRRILLENSEQINSLESFKEKKKFFSLKIVADIKDRKTDQIYYDLIDRSSILLRKNDDKLTDKKKEQKRELIDLIQRIDKVDEFSNKAKNSLKANVLEHVYSSIGQGYKGYLEVLEGWAKSEYTIQKVKSVYQYISNGTLISDLISEKVLHVDESGKLLSSWKGKRNDKPDIFKALGQGQKQTDVFIRWSVEIPGDPDSELQRDKSAWQSWIDYYLSTRSQKTFCYVSGDLNPEEPKYQPEQYPRMIRSDNDGAKLISSNDTSGFTYRGRFTDEYQVCGVDVAVAQKAHNALRWLIARQGKVFYVKNEPKFTLVAWAVSGTDIPDPLADSDDLLSDTFPDDGSGKPFAPSTGFTAQDFGNRLSQYILGYSVKLGATDEIIVMGLDSATPGRMAITYYRELTGSDFLKRIEYWHEGCAWHQRFLKNHIDEKGKTKKRIVGFFGTPAPKDIAQAAYGLRIDDNLQKTTIERLIPCIIDGRSLPWDIVDSCIKRATQRQGLSDQEWQKSLGIACGLYRYYFKEKEDYNMGLDRERKTRDYLYGRLLAVADCIENWALREARDKRPTNAARLMQRFADYPFQTWRTIALSLAPYKARMGARVSKHLAAEEEIMNLFDIDDFSLNEPLTGEFLLGFHCQRAELHKSAKDTGKENENESR